MVEVSGFPWCKDKPRTVSVASLASGILCKKHNNELSPLDDVAGRAFDTLRQATRFSNERGNLPAKRWKTRRFEIESPWLLERWFMKTALNLCALHTSDTRWRQTGRPLHEPPEGLVRMAFGREPIRAPMGLHSLATIGEQVNFSDHVTFAPLLYGEPGEMIAALFTFRGLRFLLHLEDVEPPPTLELPNVRQPEWRTGRRQYHLQRLNWTRGKKLSHYVHFLWHLAPETD